MNNRRSIFSLAVSLSLTVVGLMGLCASSIASADEVVKFRVIAHLTAVQTQEVGDVDGHTMSVGRYSGLASFPDGSVGTTNFTFTSLCGVVA